MPVNYNLISPYYDRLSRLIFSRSQVNAQLDQLSFIPKNSSVFIVGGGTGWILEALAASHPDILHIVYVESAGKMLNRAAQRDCGPHQVQFIHAAIEDFHPQQHFDVIMTAFLFDNFTPEQGHSVFEKLNDLLKVKGRWLYADFSFRSSSRQRWQHLMLKAMYMFFKLVADVKANRLLDMPTLFESKDYVPLFQQQYYQGFIESSIYTKPDL